MEMPDWLIEVGFSVWDWLQGLVPIIVIGAEA